MSISRFLTFVILITAVSLFYVHQQMEFVKTGYKIEANASRLDDLLDQNRILKYNVIALKAPFNLESRLQAKNVKLVLPERWQVIRVASWKTEKKEIARKETLPPLLAFLRFFTLSREAQAKPIE